MDPQDGQALSAFFLVIIAAGLNISCASSTSVPTPSNIATSGTTEPSDQAAPSSSSMHLATVPVAATQMVLSLRATLRFTTQDSTTTSATTIPTVETLTTTPLSKITPTNSSQTGLPPQANDGLQIKNDTLATSVASPTTVTVPHSESPEATSSHPINGSSTMIASTDTTYLSIAGITQLSSTETSAVIVSTSKKPPTQEATSGATPGASTFPGSVKGVTFSQVTLSSKAPRETSPPGSTTFSSGVTIQEVQRGLSSGSIAAITITVIAVVLLVFGIAAFLKIRHSSYGRLLDDHDYGSWGNYNNPLYDDS
ncbi:prostate androgen-regulated mucin-like protein 1 isoform X2 [Rhineura floridana]|uniref:prostate androgen-regulated mucin-like protein 1 isoform X2 n=1 Tax=Rhineura floridana TaxID=261503 RepID=UPI002AC886AD|nr:prostate androgen-regulated mucin-like protein 1 isoform X2 [Rhineura floridana]